MYSYSWLEILSFPLETDIIMLGYAPFWRISFTTVGRFEQCLCPGCVVENFRQDGKIWSQPQGRVSIETQGVLFKPKNNGKLRSRKHQNRCR